MCPQNIGPFNSIEEVPSIPLAFLDELSIVNGISDVELYEELGGDISDDFPPCGEVIITAFENTSGNGCLDNPYSIKRTFAIADDESETFCSQEIIVNPIDCDAFGSLGNLVWHDINGNGIQEFGEEGISNITVNLFSSNGIFIRSEETDSSGNYLFDNIPNGNYYLGFDIPEEYNITIPYVGNSDSNSDISNVYGYGTTELVQVSGTDRVDIDLGLYMCIPVGDKIWFDINSNNQFDESENGIKRNNY